MERERERFHYCNNGESLVKICIRYMIGFESKVESSNARSFHASRNKFDHIIKSIASFEYFRVLMQLEKSCITKFNNIYF